MRAGRLGRLLACVLSGLLLLPAGAGAVALAAAPPGDQSPEALPYVAGEVIVRLYDDGPGAAAAGPLAAGPEVAGGLEVAAVSPRGEQLLRLPDAVDVAAAVAALQADPRVRYAEPNYIVELVGEPFPSDPYFEQQWGLEAIAAPAAWDWLDEFLPMGAPAVAVAVIDTGVDHTHPDMGPVLPGYNAIDHNSDAMDDHGHGSHVAGIIAALTDNAIGVAGAAGAYPVQILPVKVLDAAGRGTTFGVAAGIDWAVASGARVINLSLGGSAYSQTLADAVAAAQNQGVLVVAAAGNSNSSVDSFFPAALPGVLTVGAVRPDLSRASFSNYGQALDLVAPGTAILAPVPAAGAMGYSFCDATAAGPACFAYLQGTSMATPFVSAAAALVAMADPSLATAALADRLKSTAADLGPAGWDAQYGHGLVQLLPALSAGHAPPVIELVSPLPGSQVWGWVDLIARVSDPDAVGAVQFAQPGVTVGRSGAEPQALYTVQWDTTAEADGPLTIAAQALAAPDGPALGPPAEVTVSVANDTATGLRWQITTPDGAPAAGAEVQVWQRDAAGYAADPVFVGFTDGQGRLEAPGALVADLHEHLAVVHAFQEDPLRGVYDPVIYVHAVTGPGLVLLGAAATAEVEVAATDVAGDALAGALLWLGISDAEGRRLPWPQHTLAQPEHPVLDSAGRARLWLSPGTYDFYALSEAGGHYLQLPDVTVSAGLQQVELRAAGAALVDCDFSVPDLEPAAAWLTLYDLGAPFGFTLPVTFGQHLVVSPGAYEVWLDLAIADADPETLWLYTLYLEEPVSIAGATQTLAAVTAPAAELWPLHSGRAPGERFEALTRFTAGPWRLAGAWTLVDGAAHAGQQGSAVTARAAAATGAAAQVSALDWQAEGPLFSVHYLAEPPELVHLSADLSHFDGVAYDLQPAAPAGPYLAAVELAGPLGAAAAAAEFDVAAAAVLSVSLPPDGAAAAGAAVALYRWVEGAGVGLWQAVFSGETAVDGTLALPSDLTLDAGATYLLQVSAVRGEPGFTEAVVLNRAVHELADLQSIDGALARPVTVSVTDAAAAPLDGATVWVQPQPFGVPSPEPWRLPPPLSLGQTVAGAVEAWVDPGAYHFAAHRPLVPGGGETPPEAGYWLVAGPVSIDADGGAAAVALPGEQAAALSALADPAYSRGVLVLPDARWSELPAFQFWQGEAAYPDVSVYVSPGSYPVHVWLERTAGEVLWVYGVEPAGAPGDLATGGAHALAFGADHGAHLELASATLEPGQVLQGSAAFTDAAGNRLTSVAAIAPAWWVLEVAGAWLQMDAAGEMLQTFEPFLSVYHAGEQVHHHGAGGHFSAVAWPVDALAAAGAYQARLALQAGPAGLIAATADFSVTAPPPPPPPPPSSPPPSSPPRPPPPPPPTAEPEDAVTDEPEDAVAVEPEPLPPPAAATMPAAQGGTLASADGSVVVAVAPGAGAADLTLRLELLDPEPVTLPGLTPVRVVKVTAAAAATAEPVRQFARPLTLRFSVADHPHPERLRLLYENETYGVWVELPSRLDRAAGVLVAEVDHLTRFVLAEGAGATALILSGVPLLVDAAELTIAGTALPGSQVQVGRDGRIVAAAEADSAGRFAAQVRLAVGRNHLVFVARRDGQVLGAAETIVYRNEPPAPPPAQPPPAPPPPAAPPPSDFADLSGHWAAAEVMAMVRRGVVQGHGDGAFAPDAPVTRAQFAAMLVRALDLDRDLDAAAELGFTDGAAVPAWAAPYLVRAHAAGLLSGYPDGSIRAAAPVSRAEAAAILDRALTDRGGLAAALPFVDADQVPPWARPAVGRMVDAGVLSGYADRTFRPEQAVSRAEAVVLLARLLQSERGIASQTPK